MSPPEGKPRYNPHVGQIEDDLESPPDYSEVAKTALYYGIKHIDEANPAGINLEGQMDVIQGRKKNRKTTLALNMVRNWCLQYDRLRGRMILWDTLESGQTPKKVKQMLVVMEATAYIAERLWGNMFDIPHRLKLGMDEYVDIKTVYDARDPSYSGTGPGNLFCLSVGFAKSGHRTPLQHEAILAARKRVNDWPLLICGAPADQGRTKALEMPGPGMPLESCMPYKRWQYFVEKKRVGIIIADHVNAYHGANDYDRQQKSIVHASAAVSELGVFMVAVCQPSMNTLREGSMEARGGTRFAEEGNFVHNTEYAQEDVRMRLECGDAREAPYPTIWVPMDKRSGLFFPDSYPVNKYEAR